MVAAVAVPVEGGGANGDNYGGKNACGIAVTAVSLTALATARHADRGTATAATTAPRRMVMAVTAAMTAAAGHRIAGADKTSS